MYGRTFTLCVIRFVGLVVKVSSHDRRAHGIDIYCGFFGASCAVRTGEEVFFELGKVVFVDDAQVIPFQVFTGRM